MPPTFYCINDSVPPATPRLLREACAARGLPYVEVDARAFDYAPSRRLAPGDLLYRPATTLAAQHVEQFLSGPGVRSFYTQPNGAFTEIVNPPLLFERAGLPIPPTVYVSTGDRDLLRGFVAQVGGFPVVVKLLGGERGIGVMQVDSFPTLFSVLDYALAQGRNPHLSAAISGAVQWRLIVVGDKIVAAYQNKVAPDDFRHHLVPARAGFTVEPPSALAEIAVRATHLLGFTFGGVDVLEQPDGRRYLLEVNFPCYFGHAQTEGGLDVAGAMVDYLLGAG